MKFIAPMLEQSGTPTMHFSEGFRGPCSPLLFWHGCNEFQFLGSQINDYQWEQSNV